MQEAGISRKIRDEMVVNGAVCWKMSDRFNSSRPDLLFVWRGITGYIEVKIYPRKTTPLQDKTLKELMEAGAPAYSLTYNFKIRKYTLTHINAGTTIVFSNHKELTAWLLQQNCSSIRKMV